MPSCHACNALCSDKVFNTVEEKREYIKENRRASRTIDLPSLPRVLDAIQKNTEVAEILFTDVPLEELGTSAPKKVIKPTDI